MAQTTSKTNRLLRATSNILHTASFRTNQYKQVIQKKIDLGAIHKKIELIHSELGKAVADQYQSGQKDPIASKEVKRVLEKLLNLQQAADLLEEEIKLIRSEPQPTAEPTDPAQENRPPD